MATVLIVEDQEQILTLAQSFLEEQGHKTLSAATADEALAILTGPEAVDALFVDIILNGEMQAGIELAKRAVELKPRLKVVYSTGLLRRCAAHLPPRSVSSTEPCAMLLNVDARARRVMFGQPHETPARRSPRPRNS